MVLVSFVLVYALCATVLLLAVAKDRRGPQGRRLGARDPGKRGRGTQHDMVFTTQH